ncbi:hypothetical protein ALP75_203017 [Pseudomonas syringae pv. actinidiae]|nr:hypothetical protein ALP75_203017 [Pseudomonas syringae pv. actinidiae]
MPGPRKALDGRRQQRIDQQLLGGLALHGHAAVADQYLLRMLLIAQRCGNTPDDQLRVPPAQSSQRQLQLHATFVADQFVPFVHHHHFQRRQGDLCIGAGQQQGQAFRRGDQCRGQASALTSALAAAGIAGTQPHRPRNIQLGQRRFKRTRRVRSQRTHGRDPQHTQRCCGRFAFAWLVVSGEGVGVGEAVERGKPHGISLAGAGAGMQKAGLAIFQRLPDFLLKRERLPASGEKPSSSEISGAAHPFACALSGVKSETAKKG